MMRSLEHQGVTTIFGYLPSFRCRRTFFSYRRGGTLARPFPVFGAVPIDASPTLRPLPRLVGTRRGGEMEQAEILHCIRARWPGRNKTPEPYFARRNFCGRI